MSSVDCGSPNHVFVVPKKTVHVRVKNGIMALIEAEFVELALREGSDFAPAGTGRLLCGSVTYQGV